MFDDSLLFFVTLQVGFRLLSEPLALILSCCKLRLGTSLFVFVMVELPGESLLLSENFLGELQHLLPCIVGAVLLLEAVEALLECPKVGCFKSSVDRFSSDVSLRSGRAFNATTAPVEAVGTLVVDVTFVLAATLGFLRGIV